MNEYRKLMESIDQIDAKGSIFDESQNQESWEFVQKLKQMFPEATVHSSRKSNDVVLVTPQDQYKLTQIPTNTQYYHLDVESNGLSYSGEGIRMIKLIQDNERKYGRAPQTEDYNPMKADEQPPAPQTDPMDLVTMDVPLLIRLFELMNETVESDADLHHITTQLLNVSKASDGPLTMEHYNEILNGQSDEPVQEGIFNNKVPPAHQAARLGVMGISEAVSLLESFQGMMNSPVAEKQIEMTLKTIKGYRKIIAKIRDTGKY